MAIGQICLFDILFNLMMRRNRVVLDTNQRKEADKLNAS